MHPILALWSVPRSASTAFERMVIERGDHHVVDEPFSVHYYFGERKVSDRFTEVEPSSSPEAIHASLVAAAATKPVFFKDMAYHLAGAPVADLLPEYRSSFLVREPSGVLASLEARWPDFTDDEAGYIALHALVAATGDEAVIIDHDDLCREPARVIAAWCELMDIPFLPEALTWEAGMRPEWARWADWHASSAASTGFRPREVTRRELSERTRKVAERVQPLYDDLRARRLRP